MKPVISFVLFFWSSLMFGQNNDFSLALATFEDSFENDNFLWKEEEVRPFITDDARVVGNQLGQFESWIRVDKEGGEGWVMVAYGVNKKMELSIGGVMGYEKSAPKEVHFSYALPLIQVKYMFKEYQPNKMPGFGVVGGTFLPVGKGAFKPSGYGAFGFFTVSQCFGEGEKVLIHANLGGSYLHIDNSNEFLTTWGVGSQIKVIKGMHFVGEIFSGDPYVPGAGIAYQTGFRYFVSDLFQFDMTVGEGIHGQNKIPFWYSAGIRIVTERFLKKKK